MDPIILRDHIIKKINSNKLKIPQNFCTKTRKIYIRALKREKTKMLSVKKCASNTIDLLIYDFD